MIGIAVIDTAVAKKSRKAESDELPGAARRASPASAYADAKGTTIPATATASEALAACRSRSKGNSRPIKSIRRIRPICARADRTGVVFGVRSAWIAPG